jgi:hypothetical protein
MNKQSNEDRARLKKLNETFLYDVGYEHMNNICDETDRLLAEYNELEVPDNLNQWFINYNRKLIRKEKNQVIRRSVLKLGKKIAAVLIVISIAGSIVTMSVEAFRVRFFNLIIETSQKFSLVSQEEVGETQVVYEVPSEWGTYYYPEFLPEGYDLNSTRALNDTKIMIFSNGTNHDIVFSQGTLSGKSQIDSENGKVIEVDINGDNGVLSIKDDIKILNWSNNEMSFNIQGNVEESVLLAIAERIIKNK